MSFFVFLLILALALALIGALVKAFLWLLFVGIALGLLAILGFGYRFGRARGRR